jgi:hypothetical protein
VIPRTPDPDDIDDPPEANPEGLDGLNGDQRREVEDYIRNLKVVLKHPEKQKYL